METTQTRDCLTSSITFLISAFQVSKRTASYEMYEHCNSYQRVRQNLTLVNDSGISYLCIRPHGNSTAFVNKILYPAISENRKACLHVKCPSLLTDLNPNWKVSVYCSTTHKYKISWKSVQSSSSSYMRMEGREKLSYPLKPSGNYTSQVLSSQ
jgi:hypothetical protein